MAASRNRPRSLTQARVGHRVSVSFSCDCPLRIFPVARAPVAVAMALSSEGLARFLAWPRRFEHFALWLRLWPGVPGCTVSKFLR